LGSAAGVDDGAVGGGDGLDDSEAEAVASLVVSPSWFEALERAEESFQLCRRNARAVVGRGQHRYLFVGFSRDVDFSASDVVKDCVVDEVLDQLFDQSDIAAHHCWLNVRDDVNLTVLGLLAVSLKHVTGDCGEVEGFGLIESALSSG
jgi:hypothetical protein